MLRQPVGVQERLSYGFVAGPGVYETTLTRPDLFEHYYLENFSLLLQNHAVGLEVGTLAVADMQAAAVGTLAVAVILLAQVKLHLRQLRQSLLRLLRSAGSHSLAVMVGLLKRKRRKRNEQRMEEPHTRAYLF